MDCREFGKKLDYAHNIRVYRDRCHKSLLKCIEYAANDDDKVCLALIFQICFIIGTRARLAYSLSNLLDHSHYTDISIRSCQADMEEMLGLCRLDVIQNVPPAYDNMNTKMVCCMS